MNQDQGPHAEQAKLSRAFHGYLVHIIYGQTMVYFLRKLSREKSKSDRTWIARHAGQIESREREERKGREEEEKDG